MSETYLEPIENYTMKLRLYPTKAQAELIDKVFRALHLAYNMTFHEVFQKNPEVCTEPNADGSVWPDFNKITKKEWKAHLVEMNPAIAFAPAASITTNVGLFRTDAVKAWKEGMGNRPVDKVKREDFHFYSSAKPRSSYAVQLDSSKIVPSPDNDKVTWISLPKIDRRIKARGFNRKLYFGDTGQYSFEEAVQKGAVSDRLTVKVSKDRCGDYYISITFFVGKKKEYSLFRELKAKPVTEEIGIDVGIKDVAIPSTGDKVENRNFKRAKRKGLRKLNRQLSRRMGPANMGFRDYNRAIREENRSLPEGEEPKPLMEPSKRYLQTQQRRARLERRIARQRESYYHQQTEKLVSSSSLIAVETLKVKNMLRNHKLAFALSDAAMSDFVSMLKYKAERRHVPIIKIGTFEPSSQLCSVCGYQNAKAKNLSVRDWICPQCGTWHDRDVNAAKNILAIAKQKGSVEDTEAESRAASGRTTKWKKPRDSIILEDRPEIVVCFSRELSGYHDPRYIVINKTDGSVVDDAQGSGFRSLSNAKNSYKAKMKWSAKQLTDL